MDESSFGIHEVKLVVNSGEHFCNCGGVGYHAYSSHDLGEVASWHYCRGLVVDAAFESSWTPVYELDGSLGLDGSYRCIYVLRDHITSLHEAACHLLAVARITLGHHCSWFECTVGNFSD